MTGHPVPWDGPAWEDQMDRIGQWSGAGRIEGGGGMEEQLRVERVEGGWRMERQDDENWAKDRWKWHVRSGERRDDGGKAGREGGWQEGKKGDGWGVMGTGWQDYGSSGQWGGKKAGSGSSPEEEGEWVTRKTGEVVWMRSDGAHSRGEKATQLPTLQHNCIIHMDRQDLSYLW